MPDGPMQLDGVTPAIPSPGPWTLNWTIAGWEIIGADTLRVGYLDLTPYADGRDEANAVVLKTLLAKVEEHPDA